MIYTVGIHPTHRRLAELVFTSEKRSLSEAEQTEMFQCLKVNAKLVCTLDKLKQLSFIAYVMGDMDWVMDICAQIEALELPLL